MLEWKINQIRQIFYNTSKEKEAMKCDRYLHIIGQYIQNRSCLIDSICSKILIIWDKEALFVQIVGYLLVEGCYGVVSLSRI